MEKIEYKITEDKDTIKKRYKSYTVEKIITKENGTTEHLYRIWFPHIDGEIEKINLDNIYFPKPITQEEWKQLSPEYRQAWLNGTMTEKICKERENLLNKINI